jgi:HK97 family phage prohead protease
MTTTKLRQAAGLRRAAAERRGESGGDREYRLARTQVPGVGLNRMVGMPTQLRAEPERRNGKDMIHTHGYFTRYERAYPMWDEFGEYEEVIGALAGRESLAKLPDVAFLVNHKGVTMARTRSGTLELAEDRQGGLHDAWLNPERQDVKDLVIAINDGDITEMSFAFMIPEGRGEWSDDFTTYRIAAYDMSRGDVSAVNYGANPYTDISARSADVLRDLSHLPIGARREAMARLGDDRDVTVRAGQPAATFTKIAEEYERKLDAFALGEDRERIEVSWRRSAPAVDPKAPSWERRLRQQHVSTANRLVAYATANDLSVAELPMVALPWFEVRNATERGDDGRTETDVLIYDEIGGSFGVDAQSFAEAIAEIDTDVINVRINSPGGSVFDGIAIHSSLLHHQAHIRTIIDGVALSAASVVAMAGDEIVVMPGGEMMIHKASMHINGNDDDAERVRDHLRRQSLNIAGMYAARAGGEPSYWMELMTAETWMFGQEAVDMKLADRVWVRPDSGPDQIEERGQDPRLHRTFELRHYRYAGRDLAPAPRRAARAQQTPGPVLDELNDVLRKGMRQPADPVDVAHQPVRDGDTSEDRTSGRSIAYIEALLESESGGK